MEETSNPLISSRTGKKKKVGAGKVSYLKKKTTYLVYQI